MEIMDTTFLPPGSRDLSTTGVYTPLIGPHVSFFKETRDRILYQFRHCIKDPGIEGNGDGHTEKMKRKGRKGKGSKTLTIRPVRIA